MKLPAKKDIGGPWKGWWPGIVVSNADPLKAGRMRVRVGAVYGAKDEDEFIADDLLPWAIPCFSAAHDGAGCAWVPPVGAEVSVLFWGGDHEMPMWAGGYYVSGEAPTEFISAYEEGGPPKTRVVKLENGHIFEMRYKDGESEIHITTEQGLKLRMIDAPEKDGLKIQVETPGGYLLALDEKGTKILVETPTQSLEMLEPDTKLTTAGNYNIQAPTGVASVWNLGALTLTAALTLVLTATGLLSLAGAGVSVVTTAAPVAVGSAAAATAVVLAAFLTAKYDVHTHLYSPGPGAPTPTGPPVPLHGGAAADVSQNVVVD